MYSASTYKMFFQNIKQHPHHYCIVADFDWTLTKYFDEHGKSRPSIISLLYNEWVLDEDYTQKAQQMHTHYVAIEHNHNLSQQERENAMEERWTRHKELLMIKWLRIQHIEHITHMDAIQIRSWVKELIEYTNKNNIPFIIFSASGIGVDSISYLLQYWWLLLPNIHIVSNKLYWDDDGNMIWYSKPVIHSLNKKESVIHTNKEYTTISDLIHTKSHFLLLGDGIGDAQMVDNTDTRHILKIGLCNDKVEDRLEKYQTVFDIVITHDKGFETILEEISYSQ